MPSPFFLISGWDRCKLALGTCVALAESIADPAATILIGRLFTDIESSIIGTLSLQAFEARVQNYIYGLVAVCGYCSLVNFAGYRIWTSLGYRLGSQARLRLCKVFLEQEISEFDEQKNLSGLAVMYFKDIQDLENATGLCSYEIVAMACGCVIELAVAFYFSWAVTLVCLAGTPLIILIGILLSSFITGRIASSKLVLDELSARVAWVLKSLPTVQTFQRESSEQEFVHKKLRKLRSWNNSYWVLLSLQQGLCRTLALMVFVQGFYFGSFMVKNHGLSAGNVVAVFWCCLNAAGLLQALLDHTIEWNRGKASAARLAELFDGDSELRLNNSIGLMPSLGPAPGQFGYVDAESILAEKRGSSKYTVAEASMKAEESEQPDQKSLCASSATHASLELAPSPQGHISLTDVVFSYPNRDGLVLSGLSMNVEAGTTAFVLGRSGSGKSTIASLLSKQYVWLGGEVEIDGHSVHLLSRNWIEENVYVCEQIPKLFDLSVLDNIKIGKRGYATTSPAEIEEAIEDSCADFVWDLPEQLNSTQISGFSGGQTQRISLARARIRNAPIMVYDEATSALDPSLQRKVINNILRYRKGKTTLIITHNYSIIPEGYPVHLVEYGCCTSFSTLADVFKYSNGEPNMIPMKDEVLKSFDLGLEEETVKEEDQDLLASVSNTLHDSDEAAWPRRRAMWLFVYFVKSIPDKPLFFLGMTFTALHASINPVFSFLFSKLIMCILDPSATRSTLWALLIVLCSCLDGLFVFLGFTLSFSAENWLVSVREKLFSMILDTPKPQQSAASSSYFTKLLLSDSEKCAEAITRFWPSILSMIILGSAGFGCSVYFGWKLTLVSVSLFPAFIVLSSIYKHQVSRWTHRREALRASVLRLMMDLTSEAGFRTLKVQHLERYFLRIYTERESNLEKITPKMTTSIGLGFGIIKGFSYAFESLLFWYGIRLMIRGAATVQNTMSVFSMLMFTVVTIDQLTSRISGVGSGFEAVERLLKCLSSRKDPARQAMARQVTPRIDDDLPKWQRILFYRVSVVHPDKTVGLREFTASINAGETVALVGPSGQGKSTIARMLMRFEAPTSGEIVIDSSWDLATISRFDVRSNVCLANQSPIDFFDGTISENLRYGLGAHEEVSARELENVCKLCGIHDTISNMKDKYETRINSGLLSGGQQQRLSIARALLRRSKVLILDECTSTQDSQSKAVILDLIRNLKLDRTMIVILITHDPEVANLADRIIDLEGSNSISVQHDLP